MFAAFKKDKNRKEITALAKDTDWLAEDDRPWEFDGEKLTV